MHRGPGEEREGIEPWTALVLCLENPDAGSCCSSLAAVSRGLFITAWPLRGVRKQMGFVFILRTRIIRCVLQGRDVEAQRPHAWQLGGCLWGLWGRCPEALGPSAPGGRAGQWRGRVSSPHSIASPPRAEVESRCQHLLCGLPSLPGLPFPAYTLGRGGKGSALLASRPGGRDIDSSAQSAAQAWGVRRSGRGPQVSR